MKKLIMLVLGLVALSTGAKAQILPAPSGSNDGNSYNGNLVNEPGLSYSKIYTLDLAKYDASKVSAQVIYSTVNYTSPAFVDGATSSGTVTVSNYLGLSSAAATNQFTIVSTSALGGSAIQVAGYTVINGSQWFTGATKQLTAVSLASALAAAVPNLSASAAGGIVYATATYGTAANSWTATSNTSNVTVAKAKFCCGQDRAVLTINGTALTSGSQWFASVSSDTTGTSIASAINTAFPTTLTAAEGTGASKGIISITSKLTGSAYNYTVVSSTQGSLTVKESPLVNGVTSGVTLGSKLITATAATGLNLGTPVLYAIGSNPAIGGLTTGTTYFAVPYGASSFYLAKFSSSAVAGLASDYATVTSTNTQALTSEHTYTLVPLSWSGSATFIWQASNDNSNWATAPSTGTVTITSGTSATDTLIDFGVFNFRYLRLNYTAPTAGSAAISVPVNIKQDGIGRF